ncbi:MAG: hypothetical protein C4519_02640 [Desulfobacteraceae bacterium]|nr:MAG: hypothetical protein C4519_02640 [Desulfobacteraceae bacterium]
MIVDVHYHYMPSMSEEGAARLVKYVMHQAEILGIHAERDALVRKILETWGDPTGEQLIRSMDEGGIDVTVAVTVDHFSRMTAETAQRQNKMLNNVVKRYPGRVIDLAGLDPRRPEAVAMARYYLEDLGMKGLKYHPDHGYHPAGPESYRVLEVLARNKGLLLTHTSPLGPPARNAFSEAALLSDLAVDFPEITIIAAHMNAINWRPWAALAGMQPTLYGDLAMWDNLAFRNYDLFCRELRTIIDLVGAHKVLFGSDAPIHTLLQPINKWGGIIRDLPAKAPAGISFTREEVDLILGGNAMRILNLGKEENML